MLCSNLNKASLQCSPEHAISLARFQAWVQTLSLGTLKGLWRLFIHLCSFCRSVLSLLFLCTFKNCLNGPTPRASLYWAVGLNNKHTPFIVGLMPSKWSRNLKNCTSPIVFWPLTKWAQFQPQEGTPGGLQRRQSHSLPRTRVPWCSGKISTWPCCMLMSLVTRENINAMNNLVEGEPLRGRELMEQTLKHCLWQVIELSVRQTHLSGIVLSF